ncbi:oxaloacetate decarboxylase [Actinosynnema sp. NPDC059335]|uniref:isocitrate lyase/PEP mutase family protein n=1 Tax=Actinosynnema sp. NPDC059335 TaxID=3346804 RepID=UPI003671DBD2
MTNVNDKPSGLPELLSRGETLVIPSMYDGISALLVKEFGFEAAYIGSYGTGATKYGLPDVGYISAEDMADQVRRLCDIVDVPIVVDGEGGWGNPVHVARAVRLLERSGAAATHLEDHEFGKHITQTPRLLAVEAATDKVKAAVDARESSDFLIIARTDAAHVEGPEAAVDRLLAYQAAGADALFIAGNLDEPAWKRLRDSSDAPVLITDLPGLTAADLGALGASAVVYYGLAHIAATQGIRRAFAELAETRATLRASEELGGIQGVIGYDSFLGIDEVRRLASAYGLLD